MQIDVVKAHLMAGGKTYFLDHHPGEFFEISTNLTYKVEPDKIICFSLNKEEGNASIVIFDNLAALDWYIEQYPGTIIYRSDTGMIRR
jgi:hypothetical protein